MTRYHIIAGRPIVGRDYWPNPTLRRLPPTWTLEEARRDRRQAELRRGLVGVWIVIAIVAGAAWILF